MVFRFKDVKFDYLALDDYLDAFTSVVFPAYVTNDNFDSDKNKLKKMIAILPSNMAVKAIFDFNNMQISADIVDSRGVRMHSNYDCLDFLRRSDDLIDAYTFLTAIRLAKTDDFNDTDTVYDDDGTVLYPSYHPVPFSNDITADDLKKNRMVKAFLKDDYAF